MWRRAELFAVDHGGRYDVPGSCILIWSASFTGDHERAEPQGEVYIRWQTPDEKHATLVKVGWDPEVVEGYPRIGANAYHRGAGETGKTIFGECVLHDERFVCLPWAIQPPIPMVLSRGGRTDRSNHGPAGAPPRDEKHANPMEPRGESAKADFAMTGATSVAGHA